MTLQNISETGDLLATIRTANLALKGGGNNTGSITLTPDATTTTLTDNRISVSSCINLMPTTANAAYALSTVYVTVASGSAIITHASHSSTDRTFKFAITGS